MSISSIRQRKLFKTNNQSSLQKLLNDSDSYEKQQMYHLKTENSDHRDSYSSRPTLQSTNLTRQLAILENKVNKQEAVAEKCFQEMESLDVHYQALIAKQNQRYLLKKKQITERIRKQEERNKKTKNNNLTMIDQIIQKMLTKASDKQNLSPEKLIKKKPILTEFKYDGRTETTSKQANGTKTNIQVASQFLEMIKFEKNHRQINKLIDHRKTCLNTDKIAPEQSQIEETLVLQIKPVQEERQSQSILLDDSIN